MGLERNGVSPERLQRLFHPRSVALIGATDNSRWSINTFDNLKQFQFPGHIYLVHPHHAIVHGERAYASLADLPEVPDLIYIMVPTSQVRGVLMQAAALGIRQAVVLTAGFSEVGGEGARLEQELGILAKENDITMLGPNGNGFINAASAITPYGLPILPPLRDGPVSIVLQSGALASTAVSFCRDHAIGISLLVSMGNETLVTATDVLNYLVEDANTRVIAMFLESIRDADQFRQVALRALKAGKPVVVLKIGKSPVSQRTALAHTGALVGNDFVNEAVLRQLGVIRVSSLEDLLLTAGFMGYYPPLPGPRMGVVTPSGGACDIIADRAEQEGLILPAFSPPVAERLKEVLPSFATVHNPLDVTGYVVVDTSLTTRALQIALDEPDFDFVLTFAAPPPASSPHPERYQAQLASIHHVMSVSHKPLIVATQTLSDISELGAEMSAACGVHFLGGIEHGMSVLGHCVAWTKMLSHQQALDGEAPALYQGPWAREPRGTWSEVPTRMLLEALGLPVVPAGFARTPKEARAIAEAFGGPVALKVVSDEILHKSDVRGVELNVHAQDVEALAELMLERVSKAMPQAPLDGVLVSPMRGEGQELLVSVSHDATWGLILMIALGGVWVEAFDDRSIRALPVSRHDIRAMLSELRGRSVLQGNRGHLLADWDRLIDVIWQITVAAQRLGDNLQALELNPVFVRGDEIEIGDALAIWNRDVLKEER